MMTYLYGLSGLLLLGGTLHAGETAAPYRVAPPDILYVNVAQLKPKRNYRLKPKDVLTIQPRRKAAR